jgi:hypothetical protein
MTELLRITCTLYNTQCIIDEANEILFLKRKRVGLIHIIGCAIARKVKC